MEASANLPPLEVTGEVTQLTDGTIVANATRGEGLFQEFGLLASSEEVDLVNMGPIPKVR